MTTQFWQNKEWKGMKAAPRQPRRMEADPFRPCVPFTWVPWCIPSESQNGPSCAGHGLGNFKEIMLRRYKGIDTFGTMEQIDGDAIWFRARKMFYAGNMDGGLYIPEAFAAAMAMGIFAPGSMLMTIPRREAMHSPQFELTPFIDGHDVSGWVNHGTNQENGQVFQGSYPDGTGGHCTVDVSRMDQDGQNFWQILNSWGVKAGWHGLYIYTESLDEVTGLGDEKYYVQEPPGWEQHDGWRKWVMG